MKKNIFYFLSCFIILVGLVSCNDEEDNSLSPLSLTIETVNQSKPEVLLGNSLELKASTNSNTNIKYHWIANGQKENTYSWTLNGKEVSTEPTYLFTGNELGTYEIKLVVSNILQGRAAATTSVNVYGKYKYGTFILNEGALLMGDKGGYLIFISPEGEITNQVFQLENNGSWLGSVPQDLFIHNGKMYIVTQNGGNEGGFLTIVNAETLKLEAAFQSELAGSSNTWPTHVAVLADDAVYLRGNAGISKFNPLTKESTFIEGSNGARKNTMAVVNGKVFAAQSKNLLVIEAGKDEVAQKIEFDSNLSGVLKSNDNNLWISLSSGKILKVDTKTYATIEAHDIMAENPDAARTLSASFAAAPSITAKGDTLYMSALASKIYRHIFKTNETKLMLDVKDMVENVGVVYNTVTVDPVSGDVYFNTIKGYGANVAINQISVFDFNGSTPVLKAAYKDYTRYPAGVFFTSNFSN